MSEITKQFLRDKYGDRFIMEHYEGSIVIKKDVINPIRHDDKTPSGKYYDNNGIIYFKDFSSPSDSFDIFKYVGVRFGISNFNDILNKIHNDLKTSVIGPIIKKPITKYKLLEKTREFNIIPRPFSEKDLAIWSVFNISEIILNYFDVKCVEQYDTIYLDTGEIVNSYKHMEDDPCYSYSFKHKGDIYNKLYRITTTLSKYKWRSNCNSEVIQGLHQLKYNNKTLIITSSLKDVMTLYSLGYEAIAPQSENVDISTKFIKSMLYVYKKIIIFYDDDKAGHEGADKIIRTMKNRNISSIFTGDSKAGDISDYMKLYGKQKTILLLNDLIK
jgi:5S rRNA maturation endonuclease (ribonuclease M5)